MPQALQRKIAHSPLMRGKSYWTVYTRPGTILVESSAAVNHSRRSGSSCVSVRCSVFGGHAQHAGPVPWLVVAAVPLRTDPTRDAARRKGDKVDRIAKRGQALTVPRSGVGFNESLGCAPMTAA